MNLSMHIIHKLFLSILLTLYSVNNYANSECKVPDGEPPTHFEDTYTQAILVGKSICENALGQSNITEIGNNLERLTVSVVDEINTAFQGKSFQQELINLIEKIPEMIGTKFKDLPSLEINSKDASDLFSNVKLIQIANNDQLTVEIDFDSTECTESIVLPCSQLFDNLVEAIEPYKSSYSKLTSKQFAQGAKKLHKEWLRYLDEARSQTLLDAWFTTTKEQDYLLQNRLVGPMTTQWFLFHPSLVVENVSDAVDGEEVRQALAIEVIGFNWWDKKSSKLGFPFGASITCLLADRASVGDKGCGLSITINNKTSIGFVSHKEGNGIYVTVDFLNLFAEKQEKWKKVVDRIERVDDN